MLVLAGPEKRVNTSSIQASYFNAAKTGVDTSVLTEKQPKTYANIASSLHATANNYSLNTSTHDRAFRSGS